MSKQAVKTKKRRFNQRKEETLRSSFWRDKNGKIVIYQKPNWLIVSWLFVSLAYWADLYTPLNRAFFGIGTLLLAAWAMLELLQGASYFRRTLGGVVLLAIIASAEPIIQIVF